VQRDVVLRTPRLVLTSWLPSDVDALFEVHSDPATMTFVRHGRPESRAETEQLLRDYIADHVSRGWTKWRLAGHDGALIGRAGFGSQDGDREIGYTIRRSHWGRGLATEIARALVDWHLSDAPGVALRGTVAVGNDSSARVLEKVGFVEVGTRDHSGMVCRTFLYPSPELATNA
jgi:[ribosomal protein S5]-alanine N-acetyltransferase